MTAVPDLGDLAGAPLAGQIDRSARVALGMATPYVLDAARELSVELGRPVLIIASRRQVERAEVGGGYVGWSTQQWSGAADARLLLGRDHGGPYQHPDDPAEIVAAMATALESFRADIEAGVRILHVDTSLGGATADQARDRAVELVRAARDMADAAGRSIEFEVGLEAQTPELADPDEFAEQAGDLMEALARRADVVPAFVVAQTGTKVSGLRNIGAITTEPVGLDRLGAIVRGLGSRLKAHNCDYLDRSAIASLVQAGAWLNVSPELGVAQTRAVLGAAHSLGLAGAAEQFSAAAIRAGHWRKWAEPGASDVDKVSLGGSYLFATAAFAELRDQLDRAMWPGATRRFAVDAVLAVARRYL